VEFDPGAANLDLLVRPKACAFVDRLAIDEGTAVAPKVLDQDMVKVDRELGMSP